ncbi:YkvA family protein [Romboutsia sp. 13368]|uniref:YkvA family protein n=1 Tax=Romboutsia sp. 13368 TaxID=2708053 RepID=UPI003FA7DC98
MINLSKISFLIDILLNTLKKTLVRFKNAKFGLLFFTNIFKIPDFLTDNRVNIISKMKLIFSLSVAIIYIISGIDFIPELITGLFGFIDDIFVLVWSLGIVNEEIEKYKKIIKDSIDPNIIENVKYNIYD